MSTTRAEHRRTAARVSPIAPSDPRHVDATLVTGDPRELARYLHDTIRLSDAEIAQVAGVAHDVTVRRWRSRASTSAPRSTERLDDLRAIVGLLLNSGLLFPEEVGRFLRARNDDLGYARPLVLLGQGDFERVREAAERLLHRLGSPQPMEGDDRTDPEDIDGSGGEPVARGQRSRRVRAASSPGSDGDST
jgi:hypothetical protein